MSLQLDARQRAMLEEFGIRMFDALPQHDRGAGPGAATRRPEPRRAASAASSFAPELIANSPHPEPAAGRFDAKTPDVQGLAPRPPGIETMELQELAAAVAQCRACALCTGRRNTVFGAGDPRPDWLVVGEPPGESEDLQGEPFAGSEGELLQNMLRALGLGRGKNVFLTDVVKCRPPANRNPEAGELAQCEPYLRRQVQLLQPRIILAMGRFAVQSLLQTTEPIGKLRGRAHHYHGVPVVVTYHPRYLMRNLPDKANAWADLCLAQGILDGVPAL